MPHHDAGVDTTLSAVWGHNFDRGFIAVGGEFVDREQVKFADRPWTNGCDRHNEIDENGVIRSQEQYYTNQLSMEWDECRLGLLAGRIIVPFAGSVYHTPGASNGGWGRWSESSLFADAFGVDSNRDGTADISFRTYDLNGKDNDRRDLFPEVQTQSFMAFGEYTFSGEANITPYFETLYARRDFFSVSRTPQFFPLVPANSPVNYCNPNAPGGIDCGLAWDALMNNPGVVEDTLAAFDCDPSTGGSCDQTVGAIGPATTRIVASVNGDRNTTDVTADQTRGVLGLRGDMPFMQVGSLDNWTFDLYGSYSLSTGESSRLGIREDRYDLAVGWYSTTNTPCVNDTGEELAPDAAPGCVPVDPFAPSLYPVGEVVGDFATPEERAYLFDSRDFDTEYEQTIFSAYATGNIFELPAGTIAMGIGAEYRKDEIKSIPDAVARDGLFFGFFSDGGAVGDVDLTELFAEVEVPIFAGTPGFQELNINLSSRLTDHEIYGENWTWSGKLGWRPTESLLIRGTFGTAFRAPNLRELYLQDQTGFLTLFDPCFVPEAAIDPITGIYNPAADTRDAIVLQNCAAQGVDPTLAFNNGFNSYSMEVAAGGSQTLDPEKSESWSAGFAWDQPFTNAFGMSLSATYYEIEVRNTIIEPGGQFIINDCYRSPTGNSVFCDRIDRDLSDPAQPFIQFLDRGFLNRDQEQARGVDINLAFDDTWTIFNRPIDFSSDIVANRQLERSTLFVSEELVPDAQSFQGEWGFPEWRVQAFFRFDYDDLRLTWETRYTGSVIQKPEEVEDFSDITQPSRGDTCLGPDLGDVQCRDFADASNYFIHNLSLYYYGDRWTFGGGIRNLFDEEPPIVDTSTVGAPLAVNRTPLGYGYDLNGRTYFFNVAVNFGGSQ